MPNAPDSRPVLHLSVGALVLTTDRVVTKIRDCAASCQHSEVSVSISSGIYHKYMRNNLG